MNTCIGFLTLTWLDYIALWQYCMLTWLFVTVLHFLIWGTFVTDCEGRVSWHDWSTLYNRTERGPARAISCDCSCETISLLGQVQEKNSESSKLQANKRTLDALQEESSVLTKSQMMEVEKQWMKTDQQCLGFWQLAQIWKRKKDWLRVAILTSHRFLVNLWEHKVGGKQIYFYVCCIDSPLHVTQSLSPSHVPQSVSQTLIVVIHFTWLKALTNVHFLKGVWITSTLNFELLFERCLYYLNYELWTIAFETVTVEGTVSPADFFFHTAVDTLQSLKNQTQNLVLPPFRLDDVASETI